MLKLRTRNYDNLLRVNWKWALSLYVVYTCSNCVRWKKYNIHSINYNGSAIKRTLTVLKAECVIFMFTSLAYIFPTAPSLETKSFCFSLFLVPCLPQAGGGGVNFGTVAMKQRHFSKNFFPTNIIPSMSLREGKQNMKSFRIWIYTEARYHHLWAVSNVRFWLFSH